MATTTFDTDEDRALFERTYGELRRLAGRRLAGERPDHTLTPTSLVHEVWVRLRDVEPAPGDRGDLLRLASTLMRRVLVDSARRRIARGRRVGTAPSESAHVEPAVADDATILRLDVALERLERCDPDLYAVVEARFLTGLGVEDAAAWLGVSTAKVKRDWRTARAFLQREIERDGR